MSRLVLAVILATAALPSAALTIQWSFYEVGRGAADERSNLHACRWVIDDRRGGGDCYWPAYRQAAQTRTDKLPTREVFVVTPTATAETDSVSEVSAPKSWVAFLLGSAFLVCYRLGRR